MTIFLFVFGFYILTRILKYIVKYIEYRRLVKEQNDGFPKAVRTEIRKPRLF